MADDNTTQDVASLQIGKNIVTAINGLQQTMANTFPQQGGVSGSATGGAATLPGNPVGFLTITLPNGTAAKVPYYS